MAAAPPGRGTVAPSAGGGCSGTALLGGLSESAADEGCFQCQSLPVGRQKFITHFYIC
jgi:hypothetical protein